MKAWLDLEHSVHAQINKNNLQHNHFLICVSGGADSMALLSCFYRILGAEKISVFHFHHGDYENIEFRNQAAKLVQQICGELKVQLYFEKAASNLKSEKEFRRARLQTLQKIVLMKPQTIVWGHHLQDLLETRLIRLIRGTTNEGLSGMKTWRAPHFRPFLNEPQSAIKSYLQTRKLEWIDDPTNLQSKYLRNWLRNLWLPALENKRPGSLNRLSVSLQNISDSIINQPDVSHLGISDKGLALSNFLTLSEFDQSRALALLLFNKGFREFGVAHIKEIRKQLDKSQKEHMFKVAGAKINVNAERIWIDI